MSVVLIHDCDVIEDIFLCVEHAPHAILQDHGKLVPEAGVVGTAARNRHGREMTRSVFMSDLDSAVAWAGKNGGDVEKLGITGFCWGGRIVWLYVAHNPKVDAGVAWYGRLVGDKNEMNPANPIDLVDKINAPVLGLYGGADAGIPTDTVDQMNAALKKAGKKSMRAMRSKHCRSSGTKARAPKPRPRP